MQFLGIRDERAWDSMNESWIRDSVEERGTSSVEFGFSRCARLSNEPSFYFLICFWKVWGVGTWESWSDNSRFPLSEKSIFHCTNSSPFHRHLAVRKQRKVSHCWQGKCHISSSFQHITAIHQIRWIRCMPVLEEPRNWMLNSIYLAPADLGWNVHSRWWVQHSIHAQSSTLVPRGKLQARWDESLWFLRCTGELV